MSDSSHSHGWLKGGRTTPLMGPSHPQIAKWGGKKGETTPRPLRWLDHPCLPWKWF
jgi:hypothetical protein